MSDAQSQFQTFHKTILLDFESNKLLRDKRDILLSELQEKIDAQAPTYSVFHQGSYELSTGVNPISGDPDMDIGIVFDCKPIDYEDPVKLKKIVKNALERTNRTIRIRKPCVTVEYLKDGVRELHIDLAIYCTDYAGVTQLARGRESDPANSDCRYWEASEAKKLNETIIDAFAGTDREQWRRLVRYMKRWRDVKFGHKNIPSIALTVEAMHQFQAHYNVLDGKPIDIIALRNMIDKTLNRWILNRLEVWLPVQPFCDLMKGVTDTQMEEFKTKLVKLRDVLNEAELEPDTHEACKLLKGQFGDDFPIPPKEDTTKKNTSSIQITGLSA